jgi:hypothetical protein
MKSQYEAHVHQTLFHGCCYIIFGIVVFFSTSSISFLHNQAQALSYFKVRQGYKKTKYVY